MGDAGREERVRMSFITRYYLLCAETEPGVRAGAEVTFWGL